MEVLLRIWVGHATHGITDRYTVDALKRDVNLRRETAEQVGWAPAASFGNQIASCAHLPLLAWKSGPRVLQIPNSSSFHRKNYRLSAEVYVHFRRAVRA